MSSAKALVLCGATEQIGEIVVELLKPEYEVIHFISSTDAACEQIPTILSGETPSSASELGSKDYSKKPIGVVVGGGFEEQDVEKMMKACEGTRAVPWLRRDLTKPQPAYGPEYAGAMVFRIKDLIPQLEQEGKMDEAKVRWY